MDKFIIGWECRQKDRKIYGWLDECTDRRTEEQTGHRQMNRWTRLQTDRQDTDRQSDMCKYVQLDVQRDKDQQVDRDTDGRTDTQAKTIRGGKTDMQ